MAALQLLHGGCIHIGGARQGVRGAAGTRSSLHVPNHTQRAAITLPQLCGPLSTSDTPPSKSTFLTTLCMPMPLFPLLTSATMAVRNFANRTFEGQL